MKRGSPLLLVLALLVVACGGDGGGGVKTGSAAAGGSSVGFQAVQAAQLKDPARTWFSAPKRQPGVAVWRDGDQLYLLAAAGEKPTGGYAVSVSEVRLVGDELQVAVTTSGPKPGDMVAQAISYPKAVVSVLGKLPDLKVVYRFGGSGAWEDAEVLR